MYHTTGFTTDQIRDLCVLVRAECGSSRSPECQDLDVEPWPPVLGLYRAVVVALTYLRRNRVQAEIAEAHGVSQPTISRAVTGITPVLDRVLTEFVPTADDLSPTAQYIVDGALAWISDPVTGNHHDSYAINDTEVLVTLNPGDWIGDKGYVGNGMITPYKKPKGGELAEWQKEYNRQVNKIRWVVEQVIANLKTWRILHTDYRRPLATFTETISCVIGLHFYRIACE
ncbi:DDE superfamily endonuclease [Micromonospora sp. Llam0]|nr:DDE superfamily endonuclease [Micromonospora sp. Llam0]